ncbi:MAG: amidohydrolase family protein [Caldilineaceae bacterium]
MAGPHTEILDLGGRTALPGIFDSHNHLMQVGVKLTRIRLDECTSPAEMMELVRAGGGDAAGHVDHRRGLEREQLHRRPLAPRHDIDPATNRHPVILMRFFNMDVINTVGLKLAGVDKATPDPEGGRIEREADGTPNGILRAASKLLVRNLILLPTQAELVEAVRLAAPTCIASASPASSTRD